MSYTPGPTQLKLLRAAIDSWCASTTPRTYQSSLRLHDRGYMDRHPKDTKKFRTNDAGKRLLREADYKLGMKYL